MTWVRKDVYIISFKKINVTMYIINIVLRKFKMYYFCVLKTIK